MRKIREVLRLRLSAGLSIRQISAGTKISVGSIQNILKLAEQHQLCWPLPDTLNDQTLALMLYPGSDARPAAKFQQPVWPELHQELKKKGVTKQLLWEEYTRQYPNRCYSYSQFCARYADWLKRQQRSMRQTHRAGDKLLIDYAGPTVPIVCAGGEIRPASIFVAVLGASSYTSAIAPALLYLLHPCSRMPKPPGARVCRTGWAAMCGPSSFSAVVQHYWCPIT
jgi:transposase